MLDADERLAEARHRARYTTGLMWHVGAYIIINGFFFAMDLFLGAEGVQWANWIAITWAFALAAHVLAWTIDGRGTEARLVRRFMDAD